MADAPVPKIRRHDLRHTHATHQLAVHANHREVADRLGHTDPAFKMRTYPHTLAGAGRRNAEAVAALVGTSASTLLTIEPEPAAEGAETG